MIDAITGDQIREQDDL